MRGPSSNQAGGGGLSQIQTAHALLGVAPSRVMGEASMLSVMHATLGG
jgi:hypothetical protein